MPRLRCSKNAAPSLFPLLYFFLRLRFSTKCLFDLFSAYCSRRFPRRKSHDHMTCFWRLTLRRSSRGHKREQHRRIKQKEIGIPRTFTIVVLIRLPYENLPCFMSSTALWRIRTCSDISSGDDAEFLMGGMLQAGQGCRRCPDIISHA